MSVSICPFEFELDAPWNRAFLIQSGKIHVSGWIRDPQGKPAKAVRILLGKRTIPTELRTALPPAGRHPATGPGAYGFETIFRTSPGWKWLRFQAEWENGETVIFSRKLLWARPGITNYQEWTRLYDQWDERKQDLCLLKQEGWKQPPLLSLVVPVYNPPLPYFKACIDSVRQQIYPHWELILIDDASTAPEIQQYLQTVESLDERIRLISLEQNQHISRASNHGLQTAQGEWIGLLDHDDLLAPHALFSVVNHIQQYPESRLIYSDEDKLDGKGKRVDPYFKPDWNPDLLLSQNYLCHFTCIHRSLFDQGLHFREGVEGAQDWDLFLRATEQLEPQQIGHIPEILYHWRIHEASTAQSTETKPYVLERSSRVLHEALERRNLQAQVGTARGGYWKIQYPLPSPPPLVSLIIPTRDRVNLLRTCVESLYEKTHYRNFEILIVDNDSLEEETLKYFAELSNRPNIRILKVPGEFNYSKLNNLACKEAKGTVFGFLNNDLEVLDGEWLDEMVSQALRPDIGCTGCKLTYPDGSIQHAGVILGILGVAGHLYRKFAEDSPTWFQHIQIVRNYTAVTAACLFIRREVYEQTDGFDETALKVAFNDIDFCLQVHRLGYRNLYTPFAHLRHHESASRGKEVTDEQIRRFQGEIRTMEQRWQSLLQNDPAYNPNLTLDAEDNGYAFPPRQRRPWE